MIFYFSLGTLSIGKSHVKKCTIRLFNLLSKIFEGVAKTGRIVVVRQNTVQNNRFLLFFYVNHEHCGSPFEVVFSEMILFKNYVYFPSIQSVWIRLHYILTRMSTYFFKRKWFVSHPC